MVSACGNCSIVSVCTFYSHQSAHAYLEGHDPGVPATLDGLLNARVERGGGHVSAVGLVGGDAWLSNDEFVEGYARILDLEAGGATRREEEGVAVLIARAGRLCATTILVSPMTRIEDGLGHSRL